MIFIFSLIITSVKIPFLSISSYNSPLFIYLSAFYIFKNRRLKKHFFILPASILFFGLIPYFYKPLYFDNFKQIIAYALMACLSIYLISNPYFGRNLLKRKNIDAVLITLTFYYLIIVIEKFLLNSYSIYYNVSNIISANPETMVEYFKSANRFSFFSREPSTAVYIICSVISAFYAGRLKTNPTLRDTISLAVSIVLILSCKGLTAYISVAYIVLFLMFSAKLILYSTISFLLFCYFLAYFLQTNFLNAILFEEFVRSVFYGYLSVIDTGIDSGSYISRFSNWIIGMNTFVSYGFWGSGIGGTQQHIYELITQGYNVNFTVEQENIFTNSNSIHNSQLFLRCITEFGIIGFSLILILLFKVNKLIKSYKENNEQSYNNNNFLFMYILIISTIEGSFLLPTFFILSAMIGTTISINGLNK
jgi:hypothetical protein